MEDHRVSTVIGIIIIIIILLGHNNIHKVVNEMSVYAIRFGGTVIYVMGQN